MSDATPTPSPPPPPPPPAPAPPEWTGQLPEELRGDANLVRFFRDDPAATVAELGRGYIETKKLVGAGKIVLPKGDDDADGWNAAFTALGRPAKPEDYAFPTLKDGETSPLVDAFRPVAHDIGLLPQQVARLDTWMKEQADAAEDQAAKASVAAVDALKTEFGDKWPEAEGHAKAAARAFDLSDELADKLCEKLGDAEAIKLFVNIGKKMGEGGTFRHGDNVPVEGVEADPQAQLDRLQADKAWREKLDAGDAATVQQRRNIIAAIAAQKQG
ncbi:MAG TPA: hypothetical protein VGB70_12750 [Allosphingosinicella sp.]